MFNLKAVTTEVIALVMPDPQFDPAPAAPSGHSRALATALVRRADGQMALETVPADSAFARDMMATGCFRNGKPIIDPVSREIMGYELEMVKSPLAFMR